VRFPFDSSAEEEREKPTELRATEVRVISGVNAEEEREVSLLPCFSEDCKAEEDRADSTLPRLFPLGSKAEEERLDSIAKENACT